VEQPQQRSKNKSECSSNDYSNKIRESEQIRKSQLRAHSSRTSYEIIDRRGTNDGNNKEHR
jgi:hypothetical protein